MEKKPFLGFQLFKQREGNEEEKKSRFGTLIFVSMEISHLKYGFVGEETLLPLSLPIFGSEEPCLCIKVIFVGVRLVLWLVGNFG